MLSTVAEWEAFTLSRFPSPMEGAARTLSVHPGTLSLMEVEDGNCKS